MSRRRQRRRASDIADVRPKRGLGAAFVLAIGLGLVILYKVGVGEETAGFIAQVTGDPELELPPSVLDLLDYGADDGPAALGNTHPSAEPDAGLPAADLADADRPDAGPPGAALDGTAVPDGTAATDGAAD